LYERTAGEGSCQNVLPKALNNEKIEKMQRKLSLLIIDGKEITKNAPNKKKCL